MGSTGGYSSPSVWQITADLVRIKAGYYSGQTAVKVIAGSMNDYDGTVDCCLFLPQDILAKVLNGELFFLSPHWSRWAIVDKSLSIIMGEMPSEKYSFDSHFSDSFVPGITKYHCHHHPNYIPIKGTSKPDSGCPECYRMWQISQ